MNRLTGVVQQLLILNVLFFVAKTALDAGLIPGVDSGFLALHYPTSERFLPLQIVTHFFMHGGFMHILFNMYALVIFGPHLEAQWGPQRFLTYYMVCAFGAAALHMGVTHLEINTLQSAIELFRENPTQAIADQTMNTFEHYAPYYTQYFYENGITAGNVTFETLANAFEEGITLKKNIPIVGASGAIFGLLLAFGMMYPEQRLGILFLPFSFPAKYFIPVMMIIELYLGVQNFQWDNIAHFAHLGGAITGFLLILYWRRFGRHPNQIN